MIFNSDSLVTTIGSYGKNDVYIFFVISGFVIPYSLFKYRFKVQNFFHFIAKRFVRIEIPYFVSIILVLIVSFIFSVYNNSIVTIEMKRLLFHILYCIEFSEYEWYNDIYWTLAIEFQFYILIGVLYRSLIHNSIYLRFITISFFLIIGVYISNFHLVFKFTPIFLLGIVLFLKIVGKINKLAFYIFIILATIVIANEHSITISIFSNTTVFLILRIKNKVKWDSWLGKISYSLYLTHGLIGGNFLYFTVRYAETQFQLLLLVIFAIIFSIIFAVFFNKIIEEPSKKLAQRFRIKS